jgi:hypothetical protein
MPTYRFLDTETNEEFEAELKLAEREPFLKDNPNVKQIIFAPNIVSGIGDWQTKIDGGFKDVLSKVADQNPETPMGQRYKASTAKEVATRNAVEKWKAKRKPYGD